MQIEINGKRNITLDFNAPKKFRLVKDGAEIPFIRTGKNSFRLSKPVDGFIELEEIVEKPRYMQPVQLQPQQMTIINPQDVDRLNEAVRQMALVNPQDVMIINQTAEQLEKNQNFIAQTQKEITNNQVYIDQQQQRLNETALGIQALETDNSQRLDGAENAILNLAGEISNAQNMAIDGMNTVSNKIEEQGVLLQAEIDTKADKEELESLKKDFEEKSDQFSSAMSNYSGGTAYDTLPQGGEAGQILAKRTDRQGDYIWIDQTPVIVKSETMPTASEKYKGEVYQYVGETGDYTHGYIYECQQNGTSYEWVRLDIQPNHSTEIESLTTRVGNLETGKQNKLTQTQMDAVNSGANQSNIAQITTNQANINTINSKIPSTASSDNQLIDKDYVDTADNILQTAISGKQDTLVSGTNIKTINNNSILGSGNLTLDGLPSQTGQSGKFLTTNGTSASWESVSVNPDNKSITLNGSSQLQTVGVIDQNNTSNAIKTWTGTKAQYDAIATKDPNTEYLCTDTGEMYLGTVKIGGGGSSRNIGEIIQSTIPLSDAGLHLLDGALISGAGSYSAFVTYIAGLVSNYPDLFITETAWQQAVTDYGVCGKFVYDSTNKTVRLPKITGFTEGTTDVTALGDLIEAGLPNIEGSTGGTSYANRVPVSGPFYLDTATTTQPSSGSINTKNVRFDASRANPIYGNSTTVQPQAIKVLYYIVIANSVKTDIQVDIDEVMTDLNGKVDKADLSPVQCVVETYVNGSSWYRIWSADSNGYWIEQGGVIDIASMQYGATSVSLLKIFNDTNYTITIGGKNLTNNGNPCFTVGNSVTTSSFNIWMERTTGNNHANQCYWKACGYGA